MSKKSFTIEVTPPIYENNIESFLFHGFTCPVCFGKKVITDEYEESEACRYCQGSGKVKATINIKWEADL